MPSFYDFVNFSDTPFDSTKISDTAFVGFDFVTSIKSDAITTIDPQSLRNKKETIYSGTFGSVIPVSLTDGRKIVLKINRLYKYLTNVERMKIAKHNSEPYVLHKQSAVVPIIRDETKYVSPKSGNREKDINQAIKNIEKYRDYKKSIHHRLSKYINDYMPKLYGFEIVDSPRRELEKIRNKPELSEEDYLNFPLHEVALMEIWEFVDPGSFSTLNFESLKSLYSDPIFVHKMPEFATGLLLIFRNEGLMVDICDADGIRAKKQDETKVGILQTVDVVKLLNDQRADIIAFPRNISFKNGRMVLYDIHPVDKVKDFVPESKVISEIAQYLKTEDYGMLRKIEFENPDYGESLRVVIRYLALLKYLGADFEYI